MSGGHFDYQQFPIEGIAAEIEYLVGSNSSRGGRNYPDDIIEKFAEAAIFLRKTAAMVQQIDWLVSGDDGPGKFRERWAEEMPENDQ